ncbi:MAG TPA: DUF1343 domain-containing protein [Bacteroidota bacterium]
MYRILFLVLLSCCGITKSFSLQSVKLGSDVLVEERLDILRDKRVGLITNQTGRLSDGTYLIDTLLSLGINVVALFGPEHGIRGEGAAGEKISDGRDSKTGVVVYSLYGATKKPTPQMLAEIDVLVYDIQDVGARFYTYISTLGLAMEAAAERGIPFVVLDRPNPLGGEKIDGPVLSDSLRSFVGMYPIPVVYGLTCGELARMINGELWLKDRISALLIVVPMRGWTRRMLWKDTGLGWIPPSPNIPFPETALVYPATCFFEATNVSEGRGTSRPFQTIGAPFIEGQTLAWQLEKSLDPATKVTPTEFTPTSSKHSKVHCRGVFFEVSDFVAFRPVAAGIHFIQTIRLLAPKDYVIRKKGLERLIGSSEVVQMILENEKPSVIMDSWLSQLQEYRRSASRYHLYP